MQFGLFLNNGVFDGVDDAAALQLSVDSARLAESLGYDRLWVTEHHFIDFGVCSSALTLAGFLLGLTQRIRVGTAVVLAPLVHPITLAEQVALLDQVSGGRLDLGLGRGGYSLDDELCIRCGACYDLAPRGIARDDLVALAAARAVT